MPRKTAMDPSDGSAVTERNKNSYLTISRCRSPVPRFCTFTAEGRCFYSLFLTLGLFLLEQQSCSLFRMLSIHVSPVLFSVLS